MSQKKDFYKNSILKQFYFSGEMSCSDLCEKTDKSVPLVTKLINELIEEGSVIEAGFAPSTGGRRPLQYTLKPDTYYILSISMDQLVTRIALMDMENNFIGDIKQLDLSLKDNAHVLLTLTTAINDFINALNIEKTKIIGVGVGMPGFIDPQKGINYSYPQMIGGENIRHYISQKVDLPVFIDNDSSLIALAELRFGSVFPEKNAMVININWGVGLGMILNGELYRGEEGFAGEFSHMPLFTNAKLCGCGKNGCLETETSLLVLIEKAKDGLKTGRVSSLATIPFEKPEEANNAIIHAAIQGDQFAVELLSEIGANIGRGVAILIHLLNPKLIILSGRGASAGKIWQAPIQQALNEHCIPRLAHITRVKISNLGYKAELIGGAALIMENFEYLHLTKEPFV